MFAPLVASATCWEAAGSKYRIDPLLLKAIAWKESRGLPSAVGPKLRDGNVALGLMQINTVHLPTLARFGIDRQKLFDACTSQEVGAWVLSDCIAQFGSTWKAVGCYYAGPKSTNTAAQVSYVRDVQRFYAGYQRQERPTPVAAAQEVAIKKD
jgi:soluble lytic murein transglycosylase-like protein